MHAVLSLQLSTPLYFDKCFTTPIVSFDQRKLHQFNLTLGGMLGLYVILSFYYIFLAQKIAIFNLGQIEFD